MIRKLNNLNTSEKGILLVATIALSLGLLYGLAWRPLDRSAQNLLQQVERNETNIQWMRQAAERVAAFRSTVPGKATGGARSSLLARVDTTARGAGLGRHIKRVEPVGKDKVRIRMEAVPFDDLMVWLEGLVGSNTLFIESLAIDRNDLPGIVDTHLTLRDRAS